MTFLVPLVVPSGCIGPFAPSPQVKPGMRLEVDADPASPATAHSVEEKSPDTGVEVTGPVEAKPGEPPKLLGARIDLSSRCEFFDEADAETAAFALVDGLWVKVRGDPRDGAIHVRKVHRIAPAPRVEVEGPVTSITPPREDGGRIVTIEPYTFDLPPDAKQTLVDVDAEWRKFLDKGILAQRAAKEQKFVPYSLRINEQLHLGGQISTTVEREDNFDLDDDRKRDRTKIEIEYELDAIWRFGEKSFALAQLFGDYQSEVVEHRVDEHDTELYPRQAYVFLADTGLDGLHFQLGRQDVEDRREWLFNTTLDAARAYYVWGPLELEGSVSETPHLLAPSEPTIQNAIAVATFKATKEWRVSSYVVDRRSRPLDEFSPFLYGVRSFVKPDPGFSHWLELSRADGVVDSRRLQGYGVDAGLTWVAPVPVEPSITVGYAMGTGDPSPSDTDRTYRQSGLQNNNDKWNGVTSFHYYGEVFDPELTNLVITTVGVGVRPTTDMSVNLVGHVYRQEEAVAQTMPSALDQTPTNGAVDDVGKELDLIVGFRGRFYSFEIVAGWFDAGPALTSRDPAWLAAAQLRLKF